ncbi:MAG: hypothetical protein LR005_01775 [Candidatus Pacebacteria bacterium]|nr:hypothetical protein [Candidatus Paceibacterota bacterium]
MNIFKKNQNFKKKKEAKQGFVILFAMVVSSIILLVSSGIYNISKKQAVLSSYARESQRAFYAANSALECAFFYDISSFINETAFPVDAVGSYSTTIDCGGRNVLVRKLNVGSTGNAGYTHSFVFRFPNPVDIDSYTSGCAYVLVEKRIGASGGDGSSVLNTRVTSSGFNTCKENPNSGFFDIPDFDDPTLLERRISSGYNTSFYAG